MLNGAHEFGFKPVPGPDGPFGRGKAVRSRPAGAAHSGKLSAVQRPHQLGLTRLGTTETRAAPEQGAYHAAKLALAFAVKHIKTCLGSNGCASATEACFRIYAFCPGLLKGVLADPS